MAVKDLQLVRWESQPIRAVTGGTDRRCRDSQKPLSLTRGDHRWGEGVLTGNGLGEAPECSAWASGERSHDQIIMRKRSVPWTEHPFPRWPR
jgi:hypothetical protein